MEKEKNKLKRIGFDDHIWNCFIDFLEQDGNHIKINGGKCLREGLTFFVEDTVNRNPIVEDYIWIEVLQNHFETGIYN